MIKKIISGGQTGVDRAALDAAISLGIEHGGYCPKGRRAEDGRIPDEYQLTETTTADYSDRTERNILESDGTLIVCDGELSGGTRLTRQIAERNNKPLLCIEIQQPILPPLFYDWIKQHSIETLNIAGPRESGVPGIANATRSILLELLRN